MVNVLLPARVAVHLRAIDRDHPRLHQPRLRAQPEHRTEQLRQRVLVTRQEPRDRRVIRNKVRSDHPIRDVLPAVTLDPTRGPLLRRIRIQNERHHHRRLIRRAPVAVSAIRRIERREIQPLHRVDHEPRQMILRQPLPQRRRHQKRLLTTTFNKVLTHPGIQLNPADGQALRDGLATTRSSGLSRAGERSAAS